MHETSGRLVLTRMSRRRLWLQGIRYDGLDAVGYMGVDTRRSAGCATDY